MKSIQSKIVLLIFLGIIVSITIIGGVGILSFKYAIDEDAQKAIESIIPKDVLEQIEKGAKLDVEMSVSDISVSVPQEIKTVIEETVKRNAIEEMQIISFMDVKAQYRLNSGEWNILDAVEEDVEIVFTIPKAYLGGSNAFYIVMYVDGVATILTDTDDDEETITIMANPNATFALCSASEVKESVKEMADWKDEFADLIDSDSVSYKDLDAIRTAKEKLDALSDDARALLEKEIGIIDAMYAAAMWYDKYKDIIESDKLTSEDLEMIKEALAEYEKLGDKAASYIDSSIIEKLENFEIHENEESEQDNNTGFAVVIAVIIAMVCAGGVIGIVLYRKRKRK